MKKALILLFSLIIIYTLSSCNSTSQKDTYFIHAAGFEDGKNGITVTFLLEKHGKDNEYFASAYSATSIRDAAQKVKSEYKECYFATCDLYFIASSISHDTICTIAKSICDSNIYPTTGDILCVSSDSVQSFMKGIKNEQFIKTIKSDSEKSKVNIVSFLADYYSGKPVTTDSFSIKDEKVKKGAKATFTSDRKEAEHEYSKR